MSKPELKPCPFCGGEAKIKRKSELGIMSIWSQCRMCGATGPSASADLSQGDKAIENIEQCKWLAEDNWNRRV